MKILKKAISALLTVVTAVTMLFTGSVTAGATNKPEDSLPYYVTYKENAEELILTIYGFSEEDYKFLTDSEILSNENLSVAIRVAFDDICFEEDLKWEYFENGNPYDYREGNYHAHDFDKKLTYGVSLSGRYSAGFNDFLGNIYEFEECDVAPDSLYYGRFMSRTVDTFSGKTKWIDFGKSANYRYAFQFILGKNQLPDTILNHILNSTNCKAHAGRFVWTYNEKGGGAEVTSVLGEGSSDSTTEYAILSFVEDGALPSRTTTQKDISSLNFSEITNKAYTGESLNPSVMVKDGSKTLTKGSDYTLIYKNNKAIGTASVTVKGKGNYSGTKTLTFQIVPKKTILTAKRSGEKITFQWDAVKGAEKYEIFYREKGEGQYKKFATVSGKKTNYSTTELAKNKTYQFQIRSYKKSNGEKVYSKFSKVVTVK